MFRFKLILIYIFLAICSLNCALARDCKFCNSKDSPRPCVQDPTSITATCSATEADPNCYTFTDTNDITFRDCRRPATCDLPTCEKCTEPDFCNDKLFPANRRKCLQCSGSDCVAPTIEKTSLPCFLKSDDECFTYVESETNIVRGCISDHSSIKCAEGNCKKCSIDNCNTDSAITKIECHKCSSETDKYCKRPESQAATDCKIDEIGKCNETALLGHKAQCYTLIKNNEIIRGCSNDKPNSTDVTEVPTFCESNMCNSGCVNDAKCYICDSKNDANCNTPDKLKEYEKPCAPFVSTCYQCENLDGTQATRGCGKNTVKDLVCQNCHGAEFCNKEKLPKSCLVCNSKNNPSCTNGPVDPQFCEQSSEDCFVLLTKAGETVRGCNSKSNTECTAAGPNCKICKDHNCNTNVLVQDGLKCFQCNSAGDCINEQTDPEKNAKQCAIQAANDQCYTYSSDGSTMMRGCVSDSSLPAPCKSNDPKCLKCSGTGCNSKSYMTDSGLSCIQCDKTDEACSWRYDSKSAIQCTSKIQYWSIDSCYISNDVDGTVSRGCMSSGKGCTATDPNCRICYDNKCNTQTLKTWACLRCRSDNNGEQTCSDKGQNIPKTPCIKTPTNETRGCYTEKYNDVIIRGCLSDLDNEYFNNCKSANYHLCDSCDTRDCNDKLAPSSSVIVYGTLSIVALCSVIVITFLN